MRTVTSTPVRLVAALAASVALLSGCGAGEGLSGFPEPATAPAAAPAPEGAPAGGAPAADRASGSEYAAGAERQVARTASLTLVVDDLRATADRIRAITASLDGWVANESLVLPEGAIDSVPAANLATLSQTKSVAAEQGFGLLFAMFNCGLAPMDDVRNRQAIMYALDYDKICKVGMSDLATPATSFVQKEHPSYNPAKVQYPGGADKAKALLAETGLKKVRVLASDHGWFASVRPMIKESLEAAGLTVDYQEKKSSDVYATIDSDPNAFDVVIAPGDPSVFGDDADLLLRWWYTGDTWTDSRMHWKGQESYTKVQELLATAAAATGDAQKAAWHEIFDVVAENVPLYPIFHRKSPTAFDLETLVDFKPIAVTGLSFVGVGSTK